VKIHGELNAQCQIKRTGFPGEGAFCLTNVHLVFQVALKSWQEKSESDPKTVVKIRYISDFHNII